jgi:tetratricopeptide (TPR) repeat protein
VPFGAFFHVEGRAIDVSRRIGIAANSGWQGWGALRLVALLPRNIKLLLSVASLMSAAFAAAENNPSQALDLEFQSAVAHYHAKQFTEAASQLEDLLPRVPKSFEVHELLGLVYAAQSQDTKAVEQLQLAVGLKPDSAAARTNLAAALVHAGKPALAGEQFRKAVDLEPHDFEANHDLGEFFIQTGKIAEATPFLEQAQRITPSSYDNGYDLALAYSLTGHLVQARQLAQSLLQQSNTSELHNLLGQIDEKDGKFLPAANEFEAAAHMDPSEQNLFDWGSEFLLHRTYEPAIDVFDKATQLHPNSPRLLIGLGMALYSRGKYDEAVKSLLKAADLDPSDPRCYRFLSHAYNLSSRPSDEVVQRFRRYAELQPRNAMAQYYYALSLLKGNRPQDASPEFHVVESLLQQSIALDGKFAEAHFQLGNLYADHHDYAKSFPEYVRATELDPNLPDAHYRLGQYYVHVGRKDLAQQEFDTYQRLRAKYLADLDKEGSEVQQFVYSSQAAAPTKP